MQDELLLDWRERCHISFISVYSENNKLNGIVNRDFALFPAASK
jgi:hypothetical protein